MPRSLYLVVISTGFDDIPVQLFPDRRSAVTFVKTCKPDKECARFTKIAGRDIPRPCAVRISRFHNGRVVSDEVLRDLDEEQEDGDS